MIRWKQRFGNFQRALHQLSRAMGAERPGSDIDLTLFEQIEHPGLRDHIQRVGRLLYQSP